MSLKHRLGPVGRGSVAVGARAGALALVALRSTGRVGMRAARALLSPNGLVILMLASGATCTVAGVWMLVGMPWALLTAGIVLFTLSGLALRGMLNG